MRPGGRVSRKGHSVQFAYLDYVSAALGGQVEIIRCII